MQSLGYGATGTRISIAKGCGRKAQHHVAALLSDSNPSSAGCCRNPRAMWVVK